MRVCIYARVSSQMQAEEEIPILGQIEECKAFAEKHGWQVVEVYKDEGFSGSTAERPALQEILRHAREKPKPFNKVVVWKGSRIARDVEGRLACERLLTRNEIDVVTVAEPMFEGPTKTLVLPIFAAVDEYYLDQVSEDTKRGLKQLAKQGYSTGGRPPKGYRTKREVVGLKKNGEPRFRARLEPDPEWRGLALKAFEMLAEGRSSADIIHETGVVKNPSSIPTYFRNPVFIGERVFNVNRRKTRKSPVVKHSLDDPEVIRIPNAHEAIIPRELWENAQRILKKRRPQRGQLRAK